MITSGDMARRLRLVRDQLSLSQRQMAEKLDISQAAVSGLEKGDGKRPSYDLVLRIVDRLGVSADWLMFGDSGPTLGYKPQFVPKTDQIWISPSEAQNDLDEELRRDLAAHLIPADLDLKATTFVPILGAPAGAASSGEGNAEDIPIEGYSALPTIYLERVVRIDPELAFILGVRGQSMESLFYDGDLVLGERLDVLDHDGVMAFAYDYGLYVKHLVRRPGRPTLMISENDRYPEEAIDHSLPFTLLGRIVRRLTRL